MCRIVPYFNVSPVQEWSTGHHAGDPQESGECEALRHGCHVHVVPGEERSSLFDVLLQMTHTLIFFTHAFHQIDNCCTAFLPPQYLKKCLTSSTKPSWKDHVSRPYRRSTECDARIEDKSAVSIDFEFQHTVLHCFQSQLNNVVIF